MRWLDYLGAVLAAALAAVNLQSPTVLSALVALQAAAAGTLILAHGRPRREAPVGVRLLAWAAVALPLLFTAPKGSLWTEGVAAAGMALTLWAMVSLREAFGVAPADRGLVQRGPYRWVRHPMYTGESLTWLGVVSTLPSWRNLALLACLLAIMAVRVWWEERLIAGYAAYRNETPWRFVPGIW